MSGPDLLPPPLRCGLFRAGHEVHFVQAIRSGNDDEVQPGTASVDAAGWISISLESGQMARLWTHNPARLAHLLREFGGQVLLRTKSILSVSHGDGAYFVSVGAGPSPCPTAAEELSDLSWGELLAKRGGITLRIAE